MQDHKLNLALIYGSTREDRLCDTVAGWVEREIRKAGSFVLDSIDPLQLELPARHESSPGPATRALTTRLAAADAFVVVTPEYNHSFPAALKFLIDSVYGAWQAKPVAFVSYGGISGGLRAVEQLRLVFAELHAVGIRDSVSFADIRNRFDEAGNLRDPDRSENSMKRMLASLHWWADALRKARREFPYADLAA